MTSNARNRSAIRQEFKYSGRAPLPLELLHIRACLFGKCGSELRILTKASQLVANA